MLTNGAPRHETGTLHVYMCLSKALYCAAVRTLSLRSCNIHGKYVAQFTGSSVTVNIVVVVGMSRFISGLPWVQNAPS